MIKLNLIKPISEYAIMEAFKCDKLFFFEEGIRSGGVGERFSALLAEKGYQGSYLNTAVNDCFIRQASVSRQLSLHRLDEQAMIEIVSGGA